MVRPTEQNPHKLTRRAALRRLGLGGACLVAAAWGWPVVRTAAADGSEPRSQSRGGTGQIPCTGCGACAPCPYGVEIVRCFGTYNEAVARGALPDPVRPGPGYGGKARRFLAGYRNAIGPFGRADRCIGCRKCEARCPERLPIVAYLRQVEALTERLAADEVRSRR